MGDRTSGGRFFLAHSFVQYLSTEDPVPIGLRCAAQIPTPRRVLPICRYESRGEMDRQESKGFGTKISQSSPCLVFYPPRRQWGRVSRGWRVASAPLGPSYTSLRFSYQEQLHAMDTICPSSIPAMKIESRIENKRLATQDKMAGNSEGEACV